MKCEEVQQANAQKQQNSITLHTDIKKHHELNLKRTAANGAEAHFRKKSEGIPHGKNLQYTEQAGYS